MTIHSNYPRYMVVVGTKAVTTKSPHDGQEGLVVCWTRSAAEKIARKTPGASVVNATEEMELAAIHEAYRMGVPWLHVGTDLGPGVDFKRVRLAILVKQTAFDGQHRHKTT